MIKIVIADDHPILRSGVRELLGNEADLVVVAEADDVASARRHIRNQRPDVLVIDLNMPGDSVLTAVPTLSSDFRGTEIVVLTMQNEPAYPHRALQEVRWVTYCKTLPARNLSPPSGRPRTTRASSTPGSVPASETAGIQKRPGGLSSRELEVTIMLALGHTNAQIGEKLHISVRTAETHRAHILQKLSIRDRQGLVQFAIEQTLISITSADL